MEIDFRTRLLNSIGSFEKVRWTAVFAFLALFEVLVHFSLPLVVTYDSGHYHLYLPILSGSEPFEAWDRARQPGYPLFLWFVRKALGGSQQAFLLTHFVLLLVPVGFALSFLWKRYQQAVPRLVGTFLVIFLILLEPFVVGYFHVLLTEALAASIAVLSCFGAVRWVELAFQPKISFKGIAANLVFWVFSVTFSYHLKQSYVFCSLVPFIVCVCFAFLRKQNSIIRLIQVGSLAIVLLTLGGSIAFWGYILPKAKTAYMQGREPTAIGAKLVVAGVARAKDLGTLEMLSEPGKAASLPAQAQYLVSEALADNLIDKNCSLLYRIGVTPASPAVLLPCKSGTVTTGEAFSFLINSLKAAPEQVVLGYLEGLLRITRILPSGVAAGGGEYDIMREMEAIGLMPYRGNSNIFWMTPELSRGVEGYRQNNVSEARGILGLLPFKWFLGHALLLFSGVLLLLVAAAPICLWLWNKARITGKEPDVTAVFVSAASATAISLFGFHIALGMVIDRYSFPAYFMGLFALCLTITKAIAWLERKGRFGPNRH